MKRRARSVAKAHRVAQLAFELLSRSNLTPRDVVKALRPAELSYLCEICAVLDQLGVCGDVWDDDDDTEEEDD